MFMTPSNLYIDTSLSITGRTSTTRRTNSFFFLLVHFETVQIAHMASQFKGFVPIHTIFYANFHPTEGSKVCYQFPPNNLQSHSINFDSFKNYIIPKPQLCHRLLTFKYGDYRIVSYPVTVNSPIYARNFFSFNFVFVFPYECATCPYEPSIKRLGKMFMLLEEQIQILSRAAEDPIYFKTQGTSGNSDGKEGKAAGLVAVAGESWASGVTSIGAGVAPAYNNFSIEDLLRRIFQDLNNYSECLIPITKGNTVDIKIFPLLRPPTSIQLSIEDVPVSLVDLNKIVDLNWDPTMISILPFIDGLNCISNISKLSDSDPNLVIECIKHLIYYNCVIITDIFKFTNIYTPTSLIHNFLTDPKLSYDCQNYVTAPSDSSLNWLPFRASSSRAGSESQTGRLRFKGLHKKSSSMVSSKSTPTSIRSGSNTSAGSDDTVSSETTSSTMNSGYVHDRKASEGSVSSDGYFASVVRTRYLPLRSTLFDLYRSLNYGMDLKCWYEKHFEVIQSNNIDVRRFIRFGLINKIIYRVHSYPVLLDSNEIMTGLDEGRQREPFTPSTTVATTTTTAAAAAAAANSGTENLLLSTSDIKLDVGDKILNSIYKKLLKVSFEDSEKNIQEQVKSKDPKLTPEERTVLLESLRNFEPMDRICIRLGKSYNDVLLLLNDTGNYKIVNI